jgi:hypothetical protein
MSAAVRCRRALAVACAVLAPITSLSACSDAHSQRAAPEPTSPPASSKPHAEVAEAAAADDDVAAVRRLAGAARQHTHADLLALPPVERARAVAACAPLSWGDFYCLGLGFRAEGPDYRALLAPEPGTPVGNLAFRRWVAQRVAMPLGRRLALQQAEADSAVSGLEKARSLSSK